MGYHPETLVFSFPSYPHGARRRGKRERWSLGRVIYRLKPWIGFDVWHIDPEKPGSGNRSDDSCGWFERSPGPYADAVRYILKDQGFVHDVALVLARRRETLAPFYEGISERQLSYPRMTAADTLAVALMVARELELRRWWNGQGDNGGAHASWWLKTFTRERGVDDLAIHLALNPSDNLSSVDRPERMVLLIAGALNRKFRPWWRHPRWHVHHWKINFDLLHNLRRMFQPCATCRRALGFGVSPHDPGDGSHHHGECLGRGASAGASHG